MDRNELKEQLLAFSKQEKKKSFQHIVADYRKRKSKDNYNDRNYRDKVERNLHVKLFKYPKDLQVQLQLHFELAEQLKIKLSHKNITEFLIEAAYEKLNKIYDYEFKNGLSDNINARAMGEEIQHTASEQ